MKLSKTLSLILLCAVLVVCGCSCNATTRPVTGHDIQIGPQTLKADVATTRADREKIRAEWDPNDDRAAALLYPTARRLALPTTAVGAPATVVWVDGSGSVVHLEERASLAFERHHVRLYSPVDARGILLFPKSAVPIKLGQWITGLPWEQPAEDYPMVSFTNGKKAWVEIAHHPEQRQQGLMWREGLSKDTGMLFIYDESRELSFWMRNTRIPLSIAYINKEGKIVRIAHMQPSSDRSHPSGEDAQFALEMEEGWFAANGIEEGEIVTLPPHEERMRDQ